MLMRKIGYGFTVALLATVTTSFTNPVIPNAEQDIGVVFQDADEESNGKRVQILDTHTGRHFTLDPNSDFNVQGAAAFSPDKQWVAFDAMEQGDRAAETKLMLAKVDGSQEMPTDLGFGCMPSFSKDGKRIAYSSYKERGVWFMGVDGKDKQLIDPNAWSITFSPADNDVVAYSTRTKEGQRIKVHNLESGEERLLITEEIDEQYRLFVHNFQWSADGSKIVVCARPRHEDSRFNMANDAVIATISTGDEPKIEVVTAAAAHSRVVFHPVTKEVFFSVRTPSKITHRIFSIDPAVPLEYRNPVYMVSQPDDRWNMICDFSDDGHLAAITSKFTGYEARIGAQLLEEDAQAVQEVSGKLKLARTRLKQGDYAAFADELMGDLNKVGKDECVKSVEEHANHWLGTINYALSRADRAKVSEKSVRFGTGKFGRDLTFVFNDGWELESTDLP